MTPLLAGLDCLAVPTVPRAYTVAEFEADPIALNSNLGSYTNFVNLLDLPPSPCRPAPAATACAAASR